jgi:hypothetical protein
MDRYYVESLGGRGWPKCHFALDRATVPHTVVSTGWLKSRRAADKFVDELNEQAGDWQPETPERDGLTRLREWAATTRAFTEAAYNPNSAPSLVREAA